MKLLRNGRTGGLLGLLAVSLVGSACAHPPPATAQRLQCQGAAGTTVAVIHQQGRPQALSLGVVAGTRECSTRSTQAPRAEGDGWRFEWDDPVLGQHYAARVSARPDGGFRVRLGTAAVAEPGWASSAPSAAVACGTLALPAEVALKPGDGACQTSEDRSEALQATWHVLREALLQRDPERLHQVLAPQVMLAEGASDDSPLIPAGQVAPHVACLAQLGPTGQRWADWARDRPHILVAPLGLDQPDAATAALGRYGGLQWRDGRWQLSWVNASRSVVLRSCD